MSKHVVIYVPGLGDNSDGGRATAVRLWRIYGVRGVVHSMRWADEQPFEPKLAGLLEHIDRLAEAGHTVSLVGESAGASAAAVAYAMRQDVIHRVVFICGKLRNPTTIHPATYSRNPAFAESMAMLPGSLGALSPDALKRMRSIHPLSDPTVPVADTLIEGAENKTIPTVGHAASIVLGITLFSWYIVGFLRQRN
jgi:pimeloyl-ACP methyl ester carboxylesterase